MKKLALLLAMVCWISGVAETGLRCRQVTTADGLTGNIINELVQDSEGYIWMATNNGLTRYDGYSTVNYTSLGEGRTGNSPKQRLAARVGRIFKDERNGLLWLNTATYQNACYDLRRERFVDWTAESQVRPSDGRMANPPQQNKLMLTSRGMVLYGMNGGATLCYMTDEGLRTWSVQVGTEPVRAGTGPAPTLADEVLTVVEDSAHNVWLPSASGLAVLTGKEPQMKQVARTPHRFIAAATSGQVTYFLGSDGTATAYDTRLQKVREVQIPAVLGHPQKVNVSFVWQGKWMLFTPEGTYTMDLKTGTIGRPNQWQIEDGLNQGTCPGFHFVANRTGSLWMFPDSGEVQRLDLIPSSQHTANKGWKFHVARSLDGRLFIATYGAGLYVYDPNGIPTLRHYGADDADAILQTDYLLCAITDRQGCIWIGTEGAGAYCLSVLDERVATYTMPQPDSHGWGNNISALTQRNDGSIFFGTRDGELLTTDYLKNTNNGFKGITRVGRRATYVTSCLTDRNGHVWMGTYGEGLSMDGQHIDLVYPPSTIHPSPSTLIINCIAEDQEGRIWIGTWNDGLLTIDAESRQVIAQQLTGNMNESRVNTLCLAPDGTLWAGTNNGIYHLPPLTSHPSPQENLPQWGEAGGGFPPSTSYNTSNGLFPIDEVHTMIMDTQGTLWVGTAGNGVIKCKLAADGSISAMETITTQEGLSNNNASSLVCDREGYVWVGTEDGISRINPRTNIVNIYHFAANMGGNTATSRCALLCADGRLLFGTYAGLLTIDPANLHVVRAAANSHVHLTDLRINGLSVYELGTSLYPLTSHLSPLTPQPSPLTPHPSPLILPHDQNSLSFHFSDFNYNRYQQTVYQYYLEGLDDGWQTCSGQNHADYKELHPGRYTLHLRSLSTEGTWGEETTLRVVIRQPWWNTWWAWAIYLLLLAAIAYYVWRNWRDKFELHQQMKMDKQLMEFRTGIFTNITHEFRTPLAIIKGAVDKLAIDGSNKAALQTAERGTNRLLRLVNQLMEYRKISTDNLRLQVEEGDIVTFVRNIYQDFWVMAKQKDIHMTFQPFDRHHQMAFDHEMVETIVYNLLSNAVKYTPEGGSIDLRMKLEGEGLKVECADSGPGISEEKQRELFKPFMHGYVSQGGMGIGLYTAHQVAQLHKGSLTYQRTDSGSLFTLTLPAEDSSYSAEDYRDKSAITSHSSPLNSVPSAVPAGASSHPSPLNPQPSTLIREMQPEAYNDLTVAIIEDNPDMADQIRREVGVYFNTVCYSTGQAVLDALTSHPSPLTPHPSLLLCDVMLPDIDGYEIVKRLRADARTAALPIIMLTALDDEEHQIKAYKAGADDYMVKPCNFRLLIARIMQLIKWSRSTPQPSPLTPQPSPLTSHPSPLTPHPSPLTPTVCPAVSPLGPPPSSQPLLESHADKVFKDKLQAIVAMHLSDANLNIDQLAQTMNMGRTKFYGKVKELMGMSPNKYLQEERMKRAAELLLEGELNVSEICYKVGIQDPSYFNKCFKAKYGVVPSKYATRP